MRPVGVGAGGQAPPTVAGVLHVGLSSGVMTELNRADAKAALEVWAASILASRGLPLRAQSEIYDNLGDLTKALHTGQLDFFALRIDEYFGILATEPPGTSFVGFHGGEKYDELVLLVRRSPTPPALGDLRGKNLIVQDSLRTGLARPWLETLLAGQGLGPSRSFFANVVTESKVSRAVLPVFFGQRDACVVTRSGFRTMVDMNPQIGRDVVAIATSPRHLSCVVGFRAGYAAAERQAVTDAILALPESARGQQVLSLFGMEKVAPSTPADFEAARQIYEAHARLVRSSGVK